MLGETDLTGHCDTVRFGFNAMELDTLLTPDEFHTVKFRKKVKMPVGSPDFPIGDRMEPGGLLLFYAAWWADVAGLAATAVVLILHLVRQSPASTIKNTR